MDISVIVPLYNEAESLPELAAWIDRVMAANGYSYEVLMVDDGSTDGSWDTVLSLAKEYRYELSPEQLEAISGGWCITKCHLYNPDCGTFGVPV